MLDTLPMISHATLNVHHKPKLKVSTSAMVDVYELLSLFGKHVASLKLTGSWPSLVLTLYVANSRPQAAWPGGVHAR